MPKINGPDISTGFWVTIGVALALFVLAAASMLYQRARKAA